MGAYCRGSDFVCVPRLPLGEDCEHEQGAYLGCAEGLICRSQCRRKRLEYESCSDPLDGCEFGTDCQQGTCVARGSSDFEDLCKP